MEKQPSFIKEFSANERQEKAEEIKSARKNSRVEQESFASGLNKLNLEVGEHDKELTNQLDALNQLSQSIEEINSLGVSRWLRYFELRNLRSQLEIGKKNYEELQEFQLQDFIKSDQLSSQANQQKLSSRQQIRENLDQFYLDQVKKWENSDFNNEEIKKYFSEEYLSKLSTDQYILLLKRFPSEMVTHVTRQGIRDHLGHMYHTAGEGVYSNSFMEMAKDGRLRSPLGVYLSQVEKDTAIKDYLIKHFRLDEISKEEAIEKLNSITNPDDNQGGSGSFQDSIALHFATEEVADSYYGSEQGNEIFIAYPSALIASQTVYSGQLNTPDRGYWNDQWVWVSEGKGLSLGAGFVFLPEKTKVDVNTGSHYELDENNNPIVNQEYIDKIKQVVSSPGFNNYYEVVTEISGKMHFNLKYAGDNVSLSDTDRQLLNALDVFRSKLESEFQIHDKRLQNVLLDYRVLQSLYIYNENPNDFRNIETETKNGLTDYGILYKESKNTVEAKDFWESYFMQNPKARPSNIVYYPEKDPELALNNWRIKNGLRKRHKEKSLGFPENSISRTDPRAVEGVDRFRTIALKVIDDYFDMKNRIQN